MRKANIGDKVVVSGKEYEIMEIYYCDWFENEGWFIEFRDTNNILHYWKQYIDGGKLVMKQKRVYDNYGCDVTDLYIKYGMPL